MLTRAYCLHTHTQRFIQMSNSNYSNFQTFNELLQAAQVLNGASDRLSAIFSELGIPLEKTDEPDILFKGLEENYQETLEEKNVSLEDQ